MKCQIIFRGKNKKKSSVSSAELAHRVVRLTAISGYFLIKYQKYNVAKNYLLGCQGSTSLQLECSKVG